MSRLRERIQARPPEPMTPRQWALAGAFIGILFALGSIARGDVAPGIVGGEATKARLDTLRNADAILQDEIRKAGLYRELWQSFCVLPDIRTVGVQGDERTYGSLVAIRAVTSDDAMTADWARLPYDLLERVSNRIINEVTGVNRVALDISSKPPGTIEWE